MGTNRLRNVVGLLRRTVSASAGELADADLLARWAAMRDEAAFEALVHRHGSAVLGVCRRVLCDRHEAEDAFQATFLALARKATSVGRKGTVIGWLCRVAYRAALAARSRTRHSTNAAFLAAAEARPNEDPAWRDLRPVLDAEVDRLPEKYRLPFLLCHVQGRTNEEAARELGCPVGTILSRLNRARGKLRERLTRRGLAPAAALITGASATALTAAVPGSLTGTTIAGALLFTANATTLGAASASAATLAESVLRSMTMAKLKIATAALLTLGLLGTGAGAVAYRMAGGPKEKPVARAAEQPKEKVEKAEPPKEKPVVVEPPVKKEDLDKKRDLLVHALEMMEDESRDTERRWEAEKLEARKSAVEREEHLRSLERTQAVEREEDLKYRKAWYEATFNKKHDPGEPIDDKQLTIWRKVENELRQREDERVKKMIVVRLANMEAEESVQRIDRVYGSQRAKLQEVIDNVRARLEQMKWAEAGVPPAEPIAPAIRDLERKVDALTREIAELRRAIERQKQKE